MRTTANLKRYGLLCLALCVLSLLGGCGERLDSPEAETRPVQILEWEGTAYTPRTDITTMLVMGLDKFERPQKLEGYTNHMQADFLMVLVLNEQAQTCELLQLNRDTMTQIRRLGVGGDVAGVFTGQLALAHTYGSGGSDSSLNAVKAVSKLLGGVKIDHYITVTMDAVGIINDQVGGVTVTVLDDFSNIAPELKQGETITLRGEQALTYVRSRGGLDNQSNERRMERQRQYLEALFGRLLEQQRQDQDFLARTLLEISDSFYSDCSVYRLDELVEMMEGCTLLPIRTLEGEAVAGEQHMEFYVDEAALMETVLELFYHPVDDMA